MIISAYVINGFTTVEIRLNDRYAIKSGICRKGLPWMLIIRCMREIFINKRARYERAHISQHNLKVNIMKQPKVKQPEKNKQAPCTREPEKKLHPVFDKLLKSIFPEVHK